MGMVVLKMLTFLSQFHPSSKRNTTCCTMTRDFSWIDIFPLVGVRVRDPDDDPHAIQWTIQCRIAYWIVDWIVDHPDHPVPA